MYYAHPSSGECFYLHLLLTAVKGATSYRHLHTVLVNGQHEECATFHEACLKLGLLEDDNEWIQCLEEAGEMATGQQLHNLFVTILVKMLLQIHWHCGFNFMSRYVMIVKLKMTIDYSQSLSAVTNVI